MTRRRFEVLIDTSMFVVRHMPDDLLYKEEISPVED